MRRAAKKAPTRFVRILAVAACALGWHATLQAQGGSAPVEPAAALAAENAALALRHASAIAGAVARSEDPAEAAELARVAMLAAEQAIATDPTLAAAYLALGLTHRQFWRWTEAAVAYARAYELDADDPNIAFNAGWFSSFRGEHERAIAIAERSVMLTPPRAAAHRDLGIAHAYAGNERDAADALTRCTELDPSISVCHIYLGFMRHRLGDDAAARESLRETERLFGADITAAGASSLGHAYSRAGLTDDARRIVANLEQMAATRVVGAGTWPLAYLAIGEVETAYQWLERAIAKIESHKPDEGFFNLMIIKWNVQANPVLDEPAFVSLRARIGAE
jgi:tetratricopeptide (TPR) repeat protein